MLPHHQRAQAMQCHADYWKWIEGPQLDLPCEHGGDKPRQEADEGRSGLGADVACLQGFADGVVPFEADGQDGENWSMSYGELHEGHCLTWKLKICRNLTRKSSITD